VKLSAVWAWTTVLEVTATTQERGSSFDFLYQAKSWDCARRVVAKVEWHKGELFLGSGSL
jgi:hypothetical protein